MPVCILGMHRSGTSMVTRLLNVAGLSLGPDDDLMPPQPHDNPAGYWERLAFSQLNDEMLEALGGRWDAPPPLDDGWWELPLFDTFRERAAALVAEMTEPWGWKDPRNSLTLPFWRSLLPELQVVCCVRNPLEVGLSLSRGGATRSVLPSRALQLWQRYYEEILGTLSPSAFLTTHYSSYFYDAPAELRRLLEAFALDASDETVRAAVATIRADLRHMAYAGLKLPKKNVPRRVGQIYRQLCSHAGPVYDAMAADKAYQARQFKENSQKQYFLLISETDRALKAAVERKALQETVAQLEEARQALEAEKASLYQSVTRLVAEHTASETEPGPSLAEHATLAEAVRRLEADKVALTEAQKQLEQDKAALLEAVGQVRQDREALLERLARLEGENATLAEATRRVESQYAEEEAKWFAVAEKVGRLEGEKAVMASGLERARQEKMEQAQQMAQLLEEKTTLAETVGRLRAEKATLASTAAQLQREKQYLTERVAGLDTEKTTLLEDISRLEAAVTARDDLASHLQQEKSGLAEEREALAQELRRLAEEHTAEKEAMEAATARLQQALDTLEERVAHLKADQEVLAATMAETEQEKAGLVERLTTLQQEKSIQATSAQVRQLQELEEKKAALEAKHEQLSKDFTHLQEAFRTMEAQRDHLLREREVVQQSLPVRLAHRLTTVSGAGVLRKLAPWRAPLRLYLDHPSPESTLQAPGTLYVSGWAFSRAAPLDRVEAFLGDEPLGTLSAGHRRPDVAAAFPRVSGAGQSGYEQMLAVPAIESGPYELIIRATDAEGHQETVRCPLQVERAAEVTPPAEEDAAQEAAQQPAQEAAPGPQKKIIHIDQAHWRDGFLELEGWIFWPNSIAPRLVTVSAGEEIVGQTRCDLSRPSVVGRFAAKQRPYCKGFRLARPWAPGSAGRKKKTFVLEITDKQGETLRHEISLRHEGESQGPQREGLGQALRRFVNTYHARTGHRPDILDWDTGLGLEELFPALAIFTPPPGEDATTLPYVDSSIAVVCCPSDEPALVREAQRVAQDTVLTIIPPSEGAPEPQLTVTWLAPAEASTTTPTVAIVIPVYNQAHYTRQLLENLQKTLPQPFQGEVLVVDDCSTDETPAMLAEMAEAWPALVPLRNAENQGFIGSCMRGAEAASSEFLLFLNNDTLPQPGWFLPLLDIFSRYPDAGAAGGKLIYPDGTLQEAGGIIFSDGSGWNFGRNDAAIDHPLYNHVREVDYCSGALLMTRRSVFFELGGFDARYKPAYYEDTDYCFTLRAHGFKVYYQPESVVVHFEGVSSGTDLNAGVKRHQVINKEKFVEKWKEALRRQPPPPPAVNTRYRHLLVVRQETEEGEAYAY